MKGYDAFAGVIKSGGKTRRAAKMVILDADHPDVLEFIDSQGARGEEGLGPHRGRLRPVASPARPTAASSSRTPTTRVRVTDEFMQAVDRRRGLDDPRGRRRRSRWTRYKARDIFRKMAEAAWLCGDPGIQYDTTINDWHTCAEHGPDLRDQPVLRVHVPQRHRLQPGLPQPHEVRPRGRRVRRRGLPLRGQADDHGPGDPRRQRQLPDAEDRGEHPPASGRSGSATPTSARCS